MLRLSLEDFICQERCALPSDFEDVPLEIPSTKLYGFYERAFRTHVISEAREKMGEVMRQAGDVLKNILEVKTMFQEQRTEDQAKVKNMMCDIARHIDQMKGTIGDVQKVMDKVEEKYSGVEKEG